MSDHSVRVGSVTLDNPIMTASGTAGQSDELSAYMDLSKLGAVVVKSLSLDPWLGNPAPRLHGTESGMINAVGLQNPGVEKWLEAGLPSLLDSGAKVVASIWGRTIQEYGEVAERLAGTPGISAVEVNVSCPNLESGGEMFAHHPDTCAAVVEAVLCANMPLWVKLSPNVTDLVPVAAAAMAAGAESLTLTNTVMGLVIDPETRRPILGNKGGGLSGPSIRPIALRSVYDIYAALGPIPIVGVGGITKGSHVVEFLAAGASAVQVGSAHFADPRASQKILLDLERWCRKRNIASVRDLTGAAHDSQ